MVDVEETKSVVKEGQNVGETTSKEEAVGETAAKKEEAQDDDTGVFPFALYPAAPGVRKLVLLSSQI